MYDRVKQPMRDHQRGEPQRAASILANCVIGRCEQPAPEDAGQQAVRVGIPREQQRSNAGDPGDDLDGLPAEKQKQRPYNVDQLCGQHQCPQRRLWRDLLGRERQAEVADEHGSSSPGLEAVAHAVGRDRRARAPRRMALHVHRHRVHRDVRRGELDVHCERGGVPAQPLRPDAEQIDRGGQFAFELRARSDRRSGCPAGASPRS